MAAAANDCKAGPGDAQLRRFPAAWRATLDVAWAGFGFEAVVEADRTG